jgi:hypothetical protein
VRFILQYTTCWSETARRTEAGDLRPRTRESLKQERQMATSGCTLNIKIGEVARPNTFKPSKPVPNPTNHFDAWTLKSKAPEPVLVTQSTIANDAASTAQAWLSHPANHMQLESLRKAHDYDNDGVTSRAEFQNLLRAAGSKADANLIFDQIDKDGDGFLTEAEIKALGQDRDGRAFNRGL